MPSFHIALSTGSSEGNVWAASAGDTPSAAAQMRMRRMEFLVSVKGLSRSRDLAQHWRGGKTGPVGQREPFQSPDDLGGAQGVHVAERPPAKRRIPDPENRPDVAVAGRSDHSFRDRKSVV